MFSKSILWSTLVTFIFFLVLPYLFYEVTESCFQEYVNINITRPDAEFNLSLLTLGVLLMSFAFVHIFKKWSGGVFSNQNGFVFGLWISLIEIVAMSFIRYATTNAFDAPFYILDGIFWTAMYAVGGVFVAMILRKKS